MKPAITAVTLLYSSLKTIIMRKLMLMAMATGVVFQAAKYFGINSMKDLRKLIMPHVKDLRGLIHA